MAKVWNTLSLIMLPIALNTGVTLTVSAWCEEQSPYRFEDHLQFVPSVVTHDNDIHVYFKTKGNVDYVKLRLNFNTEQLVALRLTKSNNVSKDFYLYPGKQSITSFGNDGGDFVVVTAADASYAELRDKYVCFLKLSMTLVDTWLSREVPDGCRDTGKTLWIHYLIWLVLEQLTVLC